MSDSTRGLYGKFNISRTDGKSAPGQKHCGCEYFVLDLDHDRHAYAALKAYAQSCKTEYPALAADLRAQVYAMEQPGYWEGTTTGNGAAASSQTADRAPEWNPPLDLRALGDAELRYAAPPKSAEIERDAARLDWLERHDFDAWGLPEIPHYMVGLKSKPPNADWCVMGRTLRETIDAAMRAAIQEGA